METQNIIKKFFDSNDNVKQFDLSEEKAFTDLLRYLVTESNFGALTGFNGILIQIAMTAGNGEVALTPIIDISNDEDLVFVGDNRIVITGNVGQVLVINLNKETGKASYHTESV